MNIFHSLSTFILCLLISSFGYSQNTCTNNLLPNPGFENGLSNWTSTGAAIISTEAHSGTKSASICNGSGSISKALPATPGMEYNASIWVKKSVGSISNGVVQLRFLTSNYSPIAGSPAEQGIANTTFTNFQLSEVAPTNAAFVHLYIYKPNGGCVFLDDAELCEADGSNDCNITVIVDSYQCDDNGTPNDPSDDLFSNHITVNNTGGGSGFVPASSFSGLISTGDYGVTYTYGPVPVAEFDSNNPPAAFIRDIDDITCTKSYTIGTPSPCSNGNGNTIDLELSLYQSNATPAKYSAYSVTATLTNNSSTTATNPKVHFAKPTGVVYTGSNPFTTSDGSFIPFGNQNWFVDDIAPGGSKTLTVNYFLLQDDAPVAYAQVIQVNEPDVDSTPNNGTPPTPNEDDEASTAIVVIPPVLETGCYFEEFYEQIPQQNNRQVSTSENADGSFTIDVLDLNVNNTNIHRQVVIDEAGVYLSNNVADITPSIGGDIVEDDGYIVANYNSNNIAVTKRNFNHDVIWQETYNISDAAQVNGTSITKLADGSFLVYGQYIKDINNTTFTPYFIKINATGGLIWLNISNEEIPFCEQTFANAASDGGFYIHHFYLSSRNYELVKLSSSGDILWKNGFPYTFAFLRLGAVEESEQDDAVYTSIAGQLLPNQNTTNFQNLVAFRKITPNGNTIWTKQYGPESIVYDHPNLLVLDDGLLITYSRAPGVFNYEKLNHEGTLLWAKEKNASVLQNIIQTADGGFLFTWRENGYPYLLKTTSEGNLSPACESNTPPTSTSLPCGVTYTSSSNSIHIEGLGSQTAIYKFFSPSWQTLAEDYGSTGNEINLDNLPAGTYHLSVKFYSATWQLECSFLEDIVITNTNFQSQNDDQLFFNATKDGRQVAINWVSNTSEITDHFLVEHSSDGDLFSKLTTLNSFGNSDGFLDYQTRDVKPLLGYNYYRLKQVYNDGTFRYTGSKAIYFDNDLSAVILFPNPVKDILYLNLEPYIGEAAEVNIVNQLGNVVIQMEIAEVEDAPVDFDVNHLTAGLYFVMVKTKYNKILTLRFVKVGR